MSTTSAPDLSAVETRKLAIVSTAHATRADRDRLEIIAPEFLNGYHARTEYGWIFTNHLNEPEWRSEGLSLELFTTLTALFAAGYDRVEFDRDGPEIAGLPTFDW